MHGPQSCDSETLDALDRLKTEVRELRILVQRIIDGLGGFTSDAEIDPAAVPTIPRESLIA